MSLVFGECKKHKGYNIINCPFCDIEKVPKFLIEQTKCNYTRAFNFISFELCIDLDDTTQIAILIQAIDYAKICNYTISPKSKDEIILNEIFILKVKSFYTIKKLKISKRYEDAKLCRQNEHSQTIFLKMKLSHLSLR